MNENFHLLSFSVNRKINQNRFFLSALRKTFWIWVKLISLFSASFLSNFCFQASNCHYVDKIMIFIHKHHDAFVLFTLKLMKNFHSSRFWLIIASILKISVIEVSKLGGKFWADIEKNSSWKRSLAEIAETDSPFRMLLLVDSSP